MGLDHPLRIGLSTLFSLVNAGSDRAFRRALSSVSAEQERVLFRILRRNEHSAFGREHSFGKIASWAEYRQRVPLSRYEDYLDRIEEIAGGKSGVLCTEEVLLFEPTSGTASGSKLIPYTAELKREFQRGIAPWLRALARTRPGVMQGPSYWSISPVMNDTRSEGTIPVGFENDGEYLGMPGKLLYRWLMPVPAHVAGETGLVRFRRLTMAYLLACENLRLISVWSPSFLTLLLESFLGDIEGVLEEMRLLGRRRVSQRIRKLDFLLGKTRPEEGLFEQIWPHLGLISCWIDGPSARPATTLKSFFPRTAFQGKGLVATEAFVSLPYFQDLDPVLALRSHAFEFEDTENGEIVLAGKLRKDRSYSVIVTSSGGLYRYRLGDRVLVTGYAAQTPALRFLGREGAVSDHFGEKLHEIHVRSVLEECIRDFSLDPVFVLMAPCSAADAGTSYALFLEEEESAQSTLKAFGRAVESRLESNFHYAYSRRIGQLGALQVFRIQGPVGIAWQVWETEMIRRGARPGAVKPAFLDSHPDWEKRFFVERL
ncbi:MAG: GH3 auxin-responsive promoter [Acidobacteria bacterium]|nr:MAG: GH3 auxin-responsive promoter [Acidobacteriota bacterium]RLE32346.1 MAG: GH3 auxin-responsive promoter [Acidobacteriota bacterium]